MSGPSQQFLRKISLLAGIGGGQAIDLSQMRIVFKVTAADVETPGILTARVYNLSDATVGQLVQNNATSEYRRIVLQAGYDGNFGIIFDGSIKQVRRGRENPTDTYVDLLAAMGDELYNFGVVNTNLAAGTGALDRYNALKRAVDPFGATFKDLANADLPGGVLPRGKVLFGMFRDNMRDLMASTGNSWSIQNGVVTVIPEKGYLPGEAVVLTAKTGMIGMPQQTNQGIKVSCLINPLIKVGGLINVNNRSVIPALHDIDRTTEGLSSQQFDGFQTLARIADDGFYRVYVMEYEGDTRGTPWYQHLTCLSVDQSAPPMNSVAG